MRAEDSDEWHHPHHFASEFSLVAEVVEPAAGTASVQDANPSRRPQTYRGPKKLHQYIYAPMDEMLYKDRPGIRCRACGQGSLLWKNVTHFASVNAVFGVLIAVASFLAIGAGAEFVFTISGESARLYDSTVERAKKLLADDEIPDGVVERVLMHRPLFREHYRDLSRDATFKLQNAAAFMEEADDHRHKLFMHRGIGAALFFGAAFGFLLAWHMFERYRVLQCDRCGDTIHT